MVYCAVPTVTVRGPPVAGSPPPPPTPARSLERCQGMTCDSGDSEGQGWEAAAPLDAAIFVHPWGVAGGVD